MNEGDGQPAVVTCERRLRANRLNAAKSTGPRTRVGKAVVACNSVAHGIYALSPVVMEFESAREWNAYRRGMLADLAPVGMVEATLTERIALAGWRLRRVTWHETEQIRLLQKDAAKYVGRRLGEHGEEGVALVENALGDKEMMADRWANARRLTEAADDEAITEDDAEDLLWQAHRQLGDDGDFDEWAARLPALESQTVGGVRRLLAGETEARGLGWPDFVRGLQDRAMSEMSRALVLGGRVERELSVYRRQHSLPDPDTLDKVMRYEAHLSRQFHRDLHELQRLQAARHGGPVVVPVAVDVEVDVNGEA